MTRDHRAARKLASVAAAAYLASVVQCLPARAQIIQPGGGSVTIASPTGPEARCTAQTVGTTAATICAAPTTAGSRTEVKITQTSAGTIGCNTDGATPTLTSATDLLTGVGAQLLYSSPGYVSQLGIVCIGSAAGITIAAVAVQTGAP